MLGEDWYELAGMNWDWDERINENSRSIFFDSHVRSYKHAEHLLATIKIGSSSRYERFREHTTVDDGRREWT